MSASQRKIAIDDLDLKIINIVVQDAKISYADIGNKLNVSAGTVFVRVKKLMETNIITGSKMIVNKYLMGYSIEGFLGICTDSSNSSTIISDELSKISGINEIHITTGKFDFLCKFMCKHIYEVSTMIEDKIKSISSVNYVEPMINIGPSKILPTEFTE